MTVERSSAQHRGSAVELERSGLENDQLDGLVARVHRVLVEDPDPPAIKGRMWALGLYKSVVLVLLLRQNPVQEAAAELFGVSQAVSVRAFADRRTALRVGCAAQ
ncbi:hypothetical protein ACFWDI_07630 [Streptomyces sp. NPDC060064]|uniref:hypothetical protein n=1 Tax=Streptomyces sp. NPDC060064 TaxID=3347049 RepID=UPI00368FCCF2